MENSEKIMDLDNEFEAGLLEEILNDRNIPHIIRSYSDSAYDGVFQVQFGWGHVEATPQYKDEIIEILEAIRNKNG